jgi:mRNA interferase MazF
MKEYKWAVIEAALDPAIGTEQKGMRPVLVVSNEEYNQVVQNVTVLPLSSTRRQLYPSEVLLPKGKAGQPIESIVMAHQVRTISRQRLGKLLGYLTDSRLQHEINEALIEHLDLE